MDKDVPRDRANLADLVNIAELSVRRVIAMAKQVSSNVFFSFCDISKIFEICVVSIFCQHLCNIQRVMIEYFFRH